MSNFLLNYFSPLDKSSCLYFLIISIIFFVILIITLLTQLMFIFKNFKQLNFRNISNGVLLLFNVFLAYFVNRLLYTMCSKSLA